MRTDPLKGSFSSYDTAEVALYREGFKRTGTISAAGPFQSRDGLIDAVITYHTDGRYVIEMRT